LPAGVDYPGYDDITVANDGRLYFGANTATGKFWTWTATTGLSTLLPANIDHPGVLSVAVSPINGRVFFGQDTGHTTDRLYTSYSGTAAASSITRSSSTGSVTGQPLTVQVPAAALNYSTTAQDINGELYFSDATGKTIDRYTYNSALGKYQRATQLG